MQAALEALGHPERDYPALHVAGTNGKGSTCAFAASRAPRRGHRVGLYTSPHLVRVNERIRVDGEDIPTTLLGHAHPRGAGALPGRRAPEPLTYFEFGTAGGPLALRPRGAWTWRCWRRAWAAGWTPPTPCGPAVTAVTPVSFDHMEFLGDTLAAIAGEKAGILKPGVPAVVARAGARGPGRHRARAARWARRSCSRAATSRWSRTSGAGDRAARTARCEDLDASGLRGAHQHQNAAVALACLELLERAAGVPVSAEAARTGLAAARWPGRLEEVAGQPPLLLDGAHNPAGVEVLVAALEAAPTRGGRSTSCSGWWRTRRCEPMLRTLLPRCASVHLTPLATPRSRDPERYLSLARSLCPVVGRRPPHRRRRCPGADSGRDRTRGARCTGSLFLVGAVKALLEHTPHSG